MHPAEAPREDIPSERATGDTTAADAPGVSGQTLRTVLIESDCRQLQFLRTLAEPVERDRSRLRATPTDHHVLAGNGGALQAVLSYRAFRRLDLAPVDAELEGAGAMRR